MFLILCMMIFLRNQTWVLNMNPKSMTFYLRICKMFARNLAYSIRRLQVQVLIAPHQALILPHSRWTLTPQTTPDTKNVSRLPPLMKVASTRSLCPGLLNPKPQSQQTPQTRSPSPRLLHPKLQIKKVAWTRSLCPGQLHPKPQPKQLPHPRSP